MSTHFPLYKIFGDEFLNLTFYSSIVGVLQYIIITRLDFSYVVNHVVNLWHILCNYTSLLSKGLLDMSVEQVTMV